MFIVANHKQDLQTQKPKNLTVELPSDIEHIRFLSNLHKKTLYFA